MQEVTWSNRGVSAKDVKSTSAQTKVLGNVEHFYRFIHGPVLRVLVDDEIDVHVSVDKVTVSRPPNGSLDILGMDSMIAKHAKTNISLIERMECKEKLYLF